MLYAFRLRRQPMKIAFVGKGGSGKTTIAGLFSRYLAQENTPVLAIDADINQHLAMIVGFSASDVNKMPHLSDNFELVKHHCDGNNNRVQDPKYIIKTTPPGRGSRFLRLPPNDDILRKLSIYKNGIHLISVGGFHSEDIGTKCYHAKTGSVEYLLNHIVEQRTEYIVVDMTAGADAFASGLFTRFDVTCLVVEPTQQSLSVYEQYKNYASEYGVNIQVIANKVEDEQDLEFIERHLHVKPAASIYRSRFVRALEKGCTPHLCELEPCNLTALQSLKDVLSNQPRDWVKYQALANYFHEKNATSWANSALGIDVSQQIDYDFRLEEAAKELGVEA